MELFQTVWKTFRSEKSVKAFTQMTFIEGRCSNAQSKVDLHTSLCEDHLLISDLWIFARTHSLTHSLTRMFSEKFRVKLRLLSWNFYTFFPVHFIAYWIGQDWQMLCWRDSCQHSIQQLGQVLLTSVTSPLLWRLCLCPHRLCDFPMCHLCSLEAFEGTLRTLEAQVFQIRWSNAHEPEMRLCLIIRLCGVQGHATNVCHLGMKLTAPFPSLLHY